MIDKDATVVGENEDGSETDNTDSVLPVPWWQRHGDVARVSNHAKGCTSAKNHKQIRRKKRKSQRLARRKNR